MSCFYNVRALTEVLFIFANGHKQPAQYVAGCMFKRTFNSPHLIELKKAFSFVPGGEFAADAHHDHLAPVR